MNVSLFLSLLRNEINPIQSDRHFIKFLIQSFFTEKRILLDPIYNSKFRFEFKVTKSFVDISLKQ